MFANSFNTFRKCSHVAKKSIGLIGVPFRKGQEKNGVEITPTLLRKAGLLAMLNNKEKMQLKDYGDLIYNDAEGKSTLNNMKNYCEFFECSVALIKKVKQILTENDMYLAIGGDHAIGFGSVAGHLLANPKTSLIWIDAHADINLNTTSKSGNIHGMPVAFLISELRKHWMMLNIESIAPTCLPTKELIYIGLRDVDPQEENILQDLGITYYAMDAIDRFGMAKIMEMTLDKLNPNNKLHVSFDIDALDVSFAPSTGTAVPGGLTLREGLYIMESLWDTNRVQGVDLVEVNPQIGTESEVQLTLQSAMQIIKTSCGYRRPVTQYSEIDHTITNNIDDINNYTDM